MSHTHEINQGQRSVGLKDRVKTARWTEVIALPPVQTGSVNTPVA